MNLEWLAEPETSRETIQRYLLQDRVRTRLQICALTESDFPASAIAWILGCGRRMIPQWTEALHGGKPLCDAPRSGRPARLGDQLRIKAVAFYCQVSPLPGCHCWSLRWAEEYLKEKPELLGDIISRSSLQRILDAHPLRPHLHKYFLQITDPDFFPKAERIIQLYLNPPERYFCLDECPCIQALRHTNPTLKADQKGRPNYEAFEYERKGTVDLIAVLDPKQGRVFGRCTPNHDTQTFRRVFREHVETQPSDAQLFYVMDNLTPHFHEAFCSDVAEISGVAAPHAKSAKERREWLGRSDKRIVIYFTPFHGSWLNMVEIWFGILKKKCLNHASFTSVLDLAGSIEDFIGTWNDDFAHPFTWKYDGTGLHGKAVRRFCTFLVDESPQMDAKFLASELLLMGNLAREYRSQIAAGDWKRLGELFTQKEEYISWIIEAENGPKRRRRVAEAAEEFRITLLPALTSPDPVFSLGVK